MKKKKNQVKAGKRSANQSFEKFLNGLELHELDAKQVEEVLGGTFMTTLSDKFHNLENWAWKDNQHKGLTIGGVAGAVLVAGVVLTGMYGKGTAAIKIRGAASSVMNSFKSKAPSGKKIGESTSEVIIPEKKLSGASDPASEDEA